MKAFPQPSLTVTDMGQVRAFTVAYDGMDLRDYFAAKAMPALVINREIHKVIYQIASQESKTPEECLAIMSYAVADAMMKAREQ
jgi:hypothetical protein